MRSGGTETRRDGQDCGRWTFVRFRGGGRGSTPVAARPGRGASGRTMERGQGGPRRPPSCCAPVAWRARTGPATVRMSYTRRRAAGCRSPGVPLSSPPGPMVPCHRPWRPEALAATCCNARSPREFAWFSRAVRYEPQLRWGTVHADGAHRSRRPPPPGDRARARRRCRLGRRAGVDVVQVRTLARTARSRRPARRRTATSSSRSAATDDARRAAGRCARERPVLGVACGSLGALTATSADALATRSTRPRG